ncbi:MAG: YjbQ family protein [Gammaproteobacteria bacterium]|nr:secondary thiamine-phosphate synthase enzyme YjbQ [Gammaproteobacteria bacterium]MCP5137579.1 YjbQ family protein [Gammaproteobacteria bacterium]
MSVFQQSFHVATRGRSTVDVSAEVERMVRQGGIHTGLCHVFCHHTSASLILCENADPQVRRDLEAFMSRLVPDGDPLYGHIDEGPDDMPAHVRMTLTQTGLSLPVSGGRVGLGTWQGIYLWEHRTMPHRRQLTVTVQGE